MNERSGLRVREERIPSIGDKMAIEPRPRSENNMYYINVHLHSTIFFYPHNQLHLSLQREEVEEIYRMTLMDL